LKLNDRIAFFSVLFQTSAHSEMKLKPNPETVLVLLDLFICMFKNMQMTLKQFQCIVSVLERDSTLSALNAIARPSVRPSHRWISQKR